MEIPTFNNMWYHEMIERHCCNTEEAKSVNPAIDGLGRCILVAACIIAEELNELTKAIKETKADGTNNRRAKPGLE